MGGGGSGIGDEEGGEDSPLRVQRSCGGHTGWVRSLAVSGDTFFRSADGPRVGVLGRIRTPPPLYYIGRESAHLMSSLELTASCVFHRGFTHTHRSPLPAPRPPPRSALIPENPFAAAGATSSARGGSAQPRTEKNARHRLRLLLLVLLVLVLRWRWLRWGKCGCSRATCSFCTRQRGAARCTGAAASTTASERYCYASGFAINRQRREPATHSNYVLLKRPSPCCASGGADGSVRRYSLLPSAGAAQQPPATTPGDGFRNRYGAGSSGSEADKGADEGVSEGEGEGVFRVDVSANPPHEGRVQALLSVRAGTDTATATDTDSDTDAEADTHVLVSAGRSGALVAHDPRSLRALCAVADAHGPGTGVPGGATAVNALACADAAGLSRQPYLGRGVFFTGGADGAVCSWRVTATAGTGGRNSAVLSGVSISRLASVGSRAIAPAADVGGGATAAAGAREEGASPPPPPPPPPAVENETAQQQHAAGAAATRAIRTLIALPPLPPSAAGGRGVSAAFFPLQQKEWPSSSRLPPLLLLSGAADGTLQVIAYGWHR